MKNPELTTFCFPDELEAKQSHMEKLLSEARSLQDQINDQPPNLDRRQEISGKVVTLLDKKTEGIYLGESVHIEGDYVVDVYSIEGNYVAFGPERERGKRQGTSHGFTAQHFTPKDETGKPVKDALITEICHLVNIINPAIRTDYLYIPPGSVSKVIAPINRSELCLTSIERIRDIQLARKNITHEVHDIHWTMGFDNLLQEPSAKNLQSLGTMLERLSSLRPERVFDYLDYINAKLRFNYNFAEVRTKEYAIGQPAKNPVWVKKEHLITGINQGIQLIEFIEVEEIKDVENSSQVRTRTIPVINLRTRLPAEYSEHNFYVPLDSIESVNFK